MLEGNQIPFGIPFHGVGIVHFQKYWLLNNMKRNNIYSFITDTHFKPAKYILM